MSEITVLVVVGSLREASLNRELAEVIAEGAPDGVRVDIAERIGELPLYNQDIDGDRSPAPVVELRERIADADALIVLTPPNNGTLSAALKNVIDWASRPYGQSSLSGKPTAIGGLGRHLGTTLADTERALTIAGADVEAEGIVAFSTAELDGKSPREHDAAVERAGALLTTLVGAVR